MWDRDANGYRLPTEAEWEYACRAGTATPFNTGKNITTYQANYNGNFPYKKNLPKGAKGKYKETTTQAGNYAPNAWGLYDMHGNVWEWCWDWYGDWYRDYSTAAETDPMGESSGCSRVIRGGGWRNSAGRLRSAYRYDANPSDRFNYLGFRLARNGA